MSGLIQNSVAKHLYIIWLYVIVTLFQLVLPCCCTVWYSTPPQRPLLPHPALPMKWNECISIMDRFFDLGFWLLGCVFCFPAPRSCSIWVTALFMETEMISLFLREAKLESKTMIVYLPSNFCLICVLNVTKRGITTGPQRPTVVAYHTYPKNYKARGESEGYTSLV